LQDADAYVVNIASARPGAPAGRGAGGN